MDTVPVITLLDLPNELLDKICEYLTFFEVITSGNTNRHLKAVTARALGTRTNLDLNLMSSESQFVKSKDEDGKLYLNSVTRVLRAYGHQIVKLRYVTLDRTQAEDIIPLIVKYCSGNNLIDLNLGELNGLSTQLIASLHPIYRHLKSLTLTFGHYNVCHSSLDLILASCVQLEKLNLNISLKKKGHDFPNDNFMLDDLLRNLIKPLKELCLNHSNYKGINYSYFSVENLVNIFEHQQLRVLKMKGVFIKSPRLLPLLHIDTNIFNELAPAMKVLSLSIGDGMELHPLLKLRHLKHLDVVVTGRRMSDFANFMQELVMQNRLECLSLRFIYLSYNGTIVNAAMQKCLGSLSHFNSLVTLKIDQSGRIADDVLECAAKLPNLMHFYALSASYSQNDIWSLVQVATKIQTLHFKCNENFWMKDFFEKLVKIRRDNQSETVLNVYAYLRWEWLCKQPKYSEMKSIFVNVFPTLENEYP